MVVRRKGGGSLGHGGEEFDCTRFGLTPPSPPSAAQIAERQARNYTHGDSDSPHPTHNQARPYRQYQKIKRPSSVGRPRIRQRSEMSTTTAISYASDDEHEFLDDLSSCGAVSETGRRPRSVTSTSECHGDAQQPRVSELDASYSIGEIFGVDDGNDDTCMHSSKNAHDGPGKRPRMSFYKAIYDTSRGESRAEGTGVRVLQRSANKSDIISGGGSQQSCSPPVLQVSVPAADATTVASDSSHVSDEEHSPRSPKSRIRDVVGRITWTSLTFFGDSEDDIDIESEKGDELFCDNDYEATFSRPGSKSVERSSETKRPRLPSSLNRIEGDLRRHETPLGLVRIVPARESSLRCILTRNGSGGSMSPRAQLAPSSSSPWVRSNILDTFSIRFPSLLVTMGCILLVASALAVTSTTDVSSLTILLGAQHLAPSVLAPTYLSLVINEIRYQAFRVASVQCRDLNAIRYDLLAASGRLQNRRLLLDLDEGEERERVPDDIMIEKLRREASFVSRQRVEERFGRGPHYVRIHVELRGNKEDDDATTEFFVVKMADVSLMPISVSSFLGQVEHGFWNEKEFDINAGHILLASGDDADVKDVANIDDLTNLGIASPIYGEYNPLRPHSELTLGFVANRPTPHFYINLQDNEEVHGRLSDQDHHFVDGEADPSFADIIDGKDVVSRVVEQVPFYEFNGQKKTVKIVRAAIDSDYTPPSLR